MRAGGSHDYEVVEGPMLKNIPGFLTKGNPPAWFGNQVVFFGSRAAEILDRSLMGLSE
jgi:hypothetical protein